MLFGVILLPIMLFGALFFYLAIRFFNKGKKNFVNLSTDITKIGFVFVILMAFLADFLLTFSTLSLVVVVICAIIIYLLRK